MVRGDPVAQGRRPMARLVAVLVLLAVGAAACTGGDGDRSEGPARQPDGQQIQEYSGPPVRGEANPIGLKWDWPRLDRYLPYVKSLAGGNTFYEFEWCQVEPAAGQRDWAVLDDVVRSSQRLGYGLLLKIRVGSCWATGGRRGEERGGKRKTVSAMPTDLGAYQGFVRAVVERYAPLGVHDYAIENEVNARNFWDGTPEEFERLTRLAADTIRAADRQARVLDSGMASPAYGLAIAEHLLAQGRTDEAVAAYRRYYTRRGSQFPEVADAGQLRQALAGELPRRALAYMAASQRLAKAGVLDAWQLHFYESWENVPALLAYLRDTLPADLPIEALEVGMFWRQGSGDQRLRAAEATKTVALLLAGGVQRIIWLPLATSREVTDEDGELRFGLLDGNGAVRPAGAAVRSIAAAAAGAKARQPATGSVSGVALTRNGSTTMVLWSDTGATLANPNRPGSKATAAGGAPVSWDPGGLRLGSEPVMATVPLTVDEALRLLR
jgi:hypothetical protein